MAVSLTAWIRQYFVSNPRSMVQEAMRAAALEFPGRPLSRHTFQTCKTEARRLGPGVDQTALETLVNAVVDDRLVGSRDRAKELVVGLFNSLKEAHQQDVMAMAVDKVRELINTHRPIEVIVKTETDEGTKRRIKKMAYTMPAEFELLLAYASIRKNILMVGPTGSGKSFIAERLAEALGLEFSSASCSVGMSEAQLAGWLLPIHAGGKFGYVPAPFIDRYTKGGVFLLDEIDNGDANVLTFMNAALANGHMYIPQRGIEGKGMARVDRHPDFICIAAANTFGTGPDALYVGRNRLDEATLNRFACQRVYLGYSEQVEQKVTAKSRKAYVWCLAVRKEIETRRLRRIMSTRNMKDFADQDASGNVLLQDVKTWENAFFADWKVDERKQVQEAGRVALKKELGIEVT